jgi:dCMP deaminase
MSKRSDYISWADYFMSIALLSAQRSKDPCTQVGACIVDSKYKIVGVGYNGFPSGCLDDKLPWTKEGGFAETKYAYVVHAEQNAIMNSYCKDLTDCILYVTLFPCHECCKLIIQSGISRIVYLKDNESTYADSVTAAKRMLELIDIRYDKFTVRDDSLVAKLLNLT